MHVSRSEKVAAARFQPERLTPQRLVWMAWNPSYRAPRLRDVVNAPFTPPGPPHISDHETRLRNAVLAAPDDDSPRRDYAEWCDRQGDERGEFIRLQLEANPTVEQQVRAALLLACHGERWRAELEPWATRDVTFERGFAEAMSLAGRAFISLGCGLFRTTPLRGVRLVAVQPILEELARCPHLARLKSLDLSDNHVGPDGVRTLGESSFRDSCHALNLAGNSLGEQGAGELARWRMGPRFRALNLRDNNLSVDAVNGLLRAPWAASLHALTLSENSLGTAILPALMASPCAAQLRTLELAAAGLEALRGDAEAFPALERLDLSFNALGLAGASDMARMFASESLRELDLGFTDCASAGVAQLVDANAWPALRRLHLRACRIDHAGANALGRGRFSQLEALDLSCNPIGSGGATALLTHRAFPRLAQLSLANCGIDDNGLSHLVRTERFAGLRLLSLAWNPLGDAGILELASSEAAANLRELDLTGTRIGLRAALALAESPSLARLHTLTLGHSPCLPAEAVALLRQRFP